MNKIKKKFSSDNNRSSPEIDAFTIIGEPRLENFKRLSTQTEMVVAPRAALADQHDLSPSENIQDPLRFPSPEPDTPVNKKEGSDFEFVGEDPRVVMTLPRRPKPNLDRLMSSNRSELVSPSEEPENLFTQSDFANDTSPGFDANDGERPRRRSDTMESKEHVPVNHAARTLQKAKQLAVEKNFKAVPDLFKPNVRILSKDGKMIQMETDELTFKKMMDDLESLHQSQDARISMVTSYPSQRPPKKGFNRPNSVELNRSQSTMVKRGREIDYERLARIRDQRRKSDTNNPLLQSLPGNASQELAWIEVKIRKDDYSSLLSSVTGMPKSAFPVVKPQYNRNLLQIKFLYYPAWSVRDSARSLADIPLKGRGEVVRYHVPVREKFKEDVRYPIIVQDLPLTISKLAEHIRYLERLYTDSIFKNSSNIEEASVVQFVAEKDDSQPLWASASIDKMSSQKSAYTSPITNAASSLKFSSRNEDMAPSPLTRKRSEAFQA